MSTYLNDISSSLAVSAFAGTFGARPSASPRPSGRPMREGGNRGRGDMEDR